jgi:disulfide bond formation protein DsbB
MASIVHRLWNPRIAAGLIVLAALATIAGALVFEYGFGLKPCPLCLRQRIPYYVAMPVALAAAVLPLPRRWALLALGVLALIFLVSAGLGVHHAGVEWGWWAGPTDCAGAPLAGPNGMGDFLNQLQTTRVISCTEAAWRFLGLSLAGWNVLISLGLVALALAALVLPRRGEQAGARSYGSSSVSQ